MNTEFIQKLKKDIALCKAISEKPKGSVPSYVKTNLIQSLTNRFETLWYNRDYETFNAGLDMIKESDAPVFARNNAIWERHANTPFESLPESPNLHNILAICRLFLTKEPTPDIIKSFSWTISSNLNSLQSQRRIKSLRRAMQMIKTVQEQKSITIFEPNERWWKYLKDEEEENPIEKNIDSGVIYEADGLTVVNNVELQRVQLIFDGGRTDKETYKLLRHNGFVFSPSNEAFQRQNTNQGIAVALRIARQLFPEQKQKEPEDNEKQKRARALMLKIKMAKANL